MKQLLMGLACLTLGTATLSFAAETTTAKTTTANPGIISAIKSDSTKVKTAVEKRMAYEANKKMVYDALDKAGQNALNAKVTIIRDGWSKLTPEERANFLLEILDTKVAWVQMTPEKRQAEIQRLRTALNSTPAK